MFSWYSKCLDYPRLILALIALLCLLAASYWPRFTFEASSDTLVVEGDPDLAYYREIESRFGGDETLFLTYTPKEFPLFSAPALDEIRVIRKQLASIKNVESVLSVLDVPLLKNNITSLSELAKGYLTLENPEIDLPLAREELRNSPLYADLLVSRDAKTTALRINLAFDTSLEELRKQRDELRLNNETSGAEYADIESRYAAAKLEYTQQRNTLINSVREVRDVHAGGAQLYLGGVPMIAADMISFIKNDVLVFGVLVTFVIILMLYLFFRQKRWVLLPLLSSAISILFLTGWLGLIRQPITVVSSNALSLLAIISLSFSIHLIVRYCELFASNTAADHAELVKETMRSKFAPCLYTALTTIVAFGSLATSDILPVEDFGWMMCAGIVCSFFVTFSFFPALLLIFPKGRANTSLEKPLAMNEWLSKISRNRAPRIIIASSLLTLIAVIGLYQVSLDNRFIDYFKADTEIRAGMQYIDQHLGGTVPFDVIVQFEPYEAVALDEEDDFFVEAEEEAFPEKYWFTPSKLKVIGQFHQYLDKLPQTGKVLSMASLDKIAREYNDGKPLDSVQLMLALGTLPDDVREEIIKPYAQPGTGEMRLSVRVKESGPMFSRDQLISDISSFGQGLGLSTQEVHVTGMMVLFNNMLKQLYTSQTSTLVYVLLATFVMFSLLLRSFLLALLGLLPNILSAAMVIAFMGYAGIPLDMMTITIAAISIGIGVDDAIHYLHRFSEEHQNCGDAREAVRRSHTSIGRAMYFTSVTVIAGFSILGFSNFVPTIYFGLLTALAMLFAMLANLSILPALLVLSPIFNRNRQP